MHRLPKVILLLSSVFAFTQCSIHQYNHKNCNKVVFTEALYKPIYNQNSVAKFNTTIDVLKNHLTGFLILKQTDSITKHLVFVTELGMKMFDFEVKNNQINTVFVFEPLNKPAFINALKRNFNDMLLLTKFGTTDCSFEKNNQTIYKSLKNNDTHFYTISNSKFMNLQETYHKKKKVSTIKYLYDIESELCNTITCKQYGIIKFYFELNTIQP